MTKLLITLLVLAGTNGLYQAYILGSMSREPELKALRQQRDEALDLAQRALNLCSPQPIRPGATQ